MSTRPIRSVTTQAQSNGHSRSGVQTPNKQGCYSATGYHSVTVSRREGRMSPQSAGFQSLEYDRATLVNQSRKFMRDNGIYYGMLERAVNYIVGNGFSLQVLSKNKKNAAKIEALWKNYWKSPEVKGIQTGERVERMIIREMFVAGDTGLIKVKNGLVQHIEAEQIAGKGQKLKNGIETTSVGKPTKYWVSPYNPSGYVQAGKAKPYEPKEFIFVTDPDRPSSIRTVPPCQSVFAMLHRINDVCDSEAIAWQLLARLAVSVTRENANSLAFDESSADTTATDDELAMRVQELDYALVFHGEPGDKIESIKHDLPGSNFPSSINMFLRLLGLPLGLPLEIILLDWTKSNYSQSRAVLEQTFKTFTSWQSLLETALNEIFDWKIRSWQASGLIKGKQSPDFDRHEWIKPSFPWLDQLKEVQAWGSKVDRSYATHGQVCKSLGFEREDIVNIREREVRDAIERSQKIEKDTKVVVPWQTFAGLEPTETVNTQSDTPGNTAKNKEDLDNE